MGLNFSMERGFGNMGTKKCKITFLIRVVKILLMVEALVDTPDIPGNGVRPEKLAPNKVFIVSDIFTRDIPADCLCTNIFTCLLPVS